MCRYSWRIPSRNHNRDSNTGDHVKKTAAYVDIVMRSLKEKGYYADELTDEYMMDVIKSAPLRVYKKAFSYEKAMEIIQDGSGKQFDPKVVEAFVDSSDEIFAGANKFSKKDSSETESNKAV